MRAIKLGLDAKKVLTATCHKDCFFNCIAFRFSRIQTNKRQALSNASYTECLLLYSGTTAFIAATTFILSNS